MKGGLGGNGLRKPGAGAHIHLDAFSVLRVLVRLCRSSRKGRTRISFCWSR